MYISVNAKQPLFLCDFKDTRIFSTLFRKIVKNQISGKSVLWKQCFSIQTVAWTDGRTDGQTDRHDEAKSSFTQFFERA